LLHHLLEVGPSTATQCSAAVDATPSACSYHLRHMSTFGLVERVVEPTGDKRERLWRCTTTAYSYGGPPSTDDVASATVRRALTVATIDDNARLAKRYLAAEATVDDAWRDAASISVYGLVVTPAELTDLHRSIDAILRPFIAANRPDPPQRARRVRVSLEMFRRVDG
jgi:hypothetical protein